MFCVPLRTWLKLSITPEIGLIKKPARALTVATPKLLFMYLRWVMLRLANAD